MKSYLRFLGRNKLYTAIEIVGLSLALAFVIVLSAYIVDDMSVNKVLKNTEDIYFCSLTDYLNAGDNVAIAFDQIPEITAKCTFNTSAGQNRMFTGITMARHGDIEYQVASMSASGNFLDFFTFPLLEGDPKEALQGKNSVIISEELADAFFPDGDAIGKEINLFEENPLKNTYPEFMDLNVNLTVTGIFKPFSKTVFHEPDIIINIGLYQEQLNGMFQGMLVFNDFHCVRLADGTDTHELARKIKEEVENSQGHPINTDYRLTAFDDLKTPSPGDLPAIQMYFCNIRNGKLFGIYLIMCIFLTIVALLDYIVLTIAFSRFRIKEIATRQLLGTDRKGVIVRCFLEAFLLLLVSCLFAVLIAVAFKGPVGQILGMELHPLTHLNEYLILAGIILMMVALASAVPSIILSSYSAINVIKGEARYKDKVTYGKLFIGIAGLLSIAALSICFGITRQTRHLMDQPLGYEHEGIIFVQFLDRGMNRHFDELKSQAYVSGIGLYTNRPDAPSATMVHKYDGQTASLEFIDGDRKYFEILGIEVLEEFSAPDGMENIYLSKSTYEATAGFRDGDMIPTWKGMTPICGIISDLKLGRLSEESSGRLMGITMINDYENSFGLGEQLCIKTEDDVDETCRKIKNFYNSKGYNDENVFIVSFREILEEQLKEENNLLKLVSGFSIICILMTIMTVVGLSSYHAKTNERDNAVRNVFGCSKRELIKKLVFSFVLPVVISAVVAIPVAYMVISRWLEGYAVCTDNSPIIYIGALSLVLIVVITAILIQGVRMMSTNPAETLKKE